MKKKCNAMSILKMDKAEILLKMKLLTLLMFAAFVSASASSYSQSVKFNLNMENVSLSDVFQKIEEQSEFIILFNEKTLNIHRKVDVMVKDETVDKILDQIFEGQKDAYQIIDRQILISKLNETSKIQPSDINIIDVQQPLKKDLSGTVKDTKGLPLPGVTVVVKGTTTGTITDSEGNYSLSIPLNVKFLAFSFIGMETLEIPVTGKTIINVTMKETTAALDEVIVVGYGSQKKESIVGAVSQVNNTALVRSGTSSITNAIAGKLSGVLTISQTGVPGGNKAEIIVRGLSSWNGSAPLILVDGVERDFSDMDPNEINTISVLKDASATAVFGSRGANGVIIVTTKRGSLGKARLNFSFNTGVTEAVSLPKFVDSYNTMSLYNVALMNQQQFSQLIPKNILEEYRNPSTPLNALRYPNVNWIDLLTNRFAPSTEANLNVQGGSDFVKYFLSFSYIGERDIFKNTSIEGRDQSYKYDRFNYRSNLDFNLTKSTQLGLTVGGNIGIKKAPTISGNDPFRQLFTASPARQPAYFPEWVLNEIPDPNYPTESGIRLNFSDMNNPYTMMQQTLFNENVDSKMFSDVLLNQDLGYFLNGLSAKGKVSVSTYYVNNSINASYQRPSWQIDWNKLGLPGVNPWIPNIATTEVYTQAPYSETVGGMGSFYTDMYYELSLNYERSFGKHNLKALALANRQHKNRGTEFPFYNQGLVGRSTYDYKGKYLFEVNVGYTGSEQFAPGNRYGFFPSGALGWVVSEEGFFKKAFPWVSKFKLRYSEGLVGSDQAPARWLYINEYGRSNMSGSTPLNNYYIKEGAAANRNAQWEQARKKDLGFELGFFKNVFTLSIDLYDENRDNMFLSPNNVTFLVAQSFKQLNIGKMKKHGLEIEAEFNKMTSKGLKYFIKGNLGLNENRVIFRDDLLYAPEYKKAAGKPLNSQTNGVLTTGTGYFTSVNDIHNNPSPVIIPALNMGDLKYLDYNSDGIISSLDKYPVEGNTYPPVIYSFSSGLSFKGFEFNILFQGNSGKWTNYNTSSVMEFRRGLWTVRNIHLDYWSPDNPNATNQTIHYYFDSDPNLAWDDGTAENGYNVMTVGRIWRNSDYLRLKELYFGYNLKSDYLKKRLNISNLNLNLTGTNLITFTKLPEGDPERKSFLDAMMNTDGTLYPTMRTVKIGLKFSF